VFNSKVISESACGGIGHIAMKISGEEAQKKPAKRLERKPNSDPALVDTE
jgi:hypothetical protein